MSDLINRDRLIKELYKAECNYRMEYHDCIMNDDPFSYGVLSAIFQFSKIIKSQPTAYDIDKVVEELEKLKNEKTIGSHKVMIKETIEIVKQGGVFNDVCEWRANNDLAFECRKGEI